MVLWLKLIISYIANNKKSFLLGLALSLTLIFNYQRFLPYIFKPETKTIGIVGNFTLGTLPAEIQEKLSIGLVKISPSGEILPAGAKSWEATEGGKIYKFALGEKLNSTDINYNLRGVEILRPDNKTVVFSLKEPFAPLLSLLSQPLFKQGLEGFGDYKLTEVKLAGRFLESIKLVLKNGGETTLYKFYSSEKDAWTAFKLGDVKQVRDLFTRPGDLPKKTKVTDVVQNYSIAVLFFNNAKKPFDDKTFRQGLTYALPDVWPQGEAAFGPVPKDFWISDVSSKRYPQNMPLAKKLAPKTKIILQTSAITESSAKTIQAAWTEAGFETQIQISETPGVNFDAYLTLIDLPHDPDQYALWHSTQRGNIANFKNFKVDKILEEGRRTIDNGERKTIYADFQKALTEEAPAAFLFYPKVYTISKYE